MWDLAWRAAASDGAKDDLPASITQQESEGVLYDVIICRGELASILGYISRSAPHARPQMRLYI